MTDIVERIRARFDHAAAKKILQEKYQAKMLFAYAGGMWRAGPELLTLLQAVSSHSNVVILDIYDNPINVDTQELQKLAIERWQEQMNAWLMESEEIRKSR